MQVEELHYRIRFEWDKLGNAHRRYLSDLELDQVINSSVFDYVEIFYHGKNSQGFDLGFEVNGQMIDMLDTLVVGYPDEPELSLQQISDDMYKADFTQTTKPFKGYISSSVRLADCDNYAGVNIEQHGDMNKTNVSFHRRASKRWRVIPGYLRGDSLYLKSDGIALDSMRLSYLRKPAIVALGTYSEIPTVDNPTPGLRPRQECDLPEDYHPLLVRIAVQNLHRIYGNQNDKVLTDQKINELT